MFLAPVSPGGQLRPAGFVSGLTDGQFLEVRSGDLKAGDLIVIGLATSQGKDAGGLANMMGPRRR